VSRWANIEAFYADDPRRRASGEVDYGVHWTEPGSRWPQYRVSFVEETGELYAAELKPLPIDEGRVELLGKFDDREAVDRALRGWPDACGPGGMDWIRARCR